MKKSLLQQPILLEDKGLWGWLEPPVKYGIQGGRVRFYQHNHKLMFSLPWDKKGESLAGGYTWILWLRKHGSRGWLTTGYKGKEIECKYWIHPDTIKEIYDTLIVSAINNGGYLEGPEYQLSNFPSKQPTLSMQEIHSILGV